jgi:hypothetical protein
MHPTPNQGNSPWGKFLFFFSGETFMSYLNAQSRMFIRGLIIFVSITFVNTSAGVAFAVCWIIFMLQQNSRDKPLKDSDEGSCYIPKPLDRENAYEGVVTGFGSDHYQHDSEQSRSFFIQLTFHGSIQELWGVDLKRVIREKGLSIGDQVELLYKGAVPVLVDERLPNSTETRQVTRYRNSWDALKVITS